MADLTAVDRDAPLQVRFPAPMNVETVQFGFDPPVTFSVVWEPPLGLFGIADNAQVAWVHHDPFRPGIDYRFWVEESRTADGRDVVPRSWSFRAALWRYILPVIRKGV